MSATSKDVIFHILYRDDPGLTMDLCKQATQRIANTIQDPVPFELLNIANRSPHMARCIFILLLNIDMTLKETVVKPVELPEVGITLPGLCGYKAPVFFKELDGRIIPNFLRDELKLTIDFEREVQEVYQYS